MTERERVLIALKGGQPDRIPFLDYVDKDMRHKIMKRDDFDELDLAKEMQFDAIQCEGMWPPFFAVFDKERSATDLDGIIAGLIKTRDDLKLAKFPPLDDAFFEYPNRFIEKYAKEGYALYYRTRMGCSGVLNSMGLEGFSYALVDDPYVIETLMDMYVEWVIELLDKTQDMGFDFVWFADDLAFNTGPMFSPQVFREVFLPKMKKVAEHVKLPWVYHSDGNLMPLIDDLLSLGMNGLNPIEPGAMDIEQMKRDYGERICLIGNVDIRYTLTRGTTQEVEAEVKSRIDTIGKGGGYIISSSNSIPNYCKLENVLAMRDAIVKYRDYA